MNVGDRVRLKADFGVCHECPDNRPLLRAGTVGTVTHISFWDMAPWPVTVDFGDDEYMFEVDELDVTD